MNMKSKISTHNDTEIAKNDFVNFKGASVLWPPECSDDCLEYAIGKARTLKVDYNVDDEGLKISEELKKAMDEKYQPYWHVICGRNFGCYAIHESNCFIFFTLGGISFLLYKAG